VKKYEFKIEQILVVRQIFLASHGDGMNCLLKTSLLISTSAVSSCYAMLL